MKIQEKLTQFDLLLAQPQLALESVTDWLADLPLSPPLFTCKLLHKAMARLMVFGLTPSLACGLFNLLHRTLQQLGQQHSRDNLLHVLANYAENQRVSLYLDCVQIKFAKNCLNLLMSRDENLTRTEKALLVHRAMSELGLVLVRRAQLYLSAPKGLWLKLHDLYRYAASQQLLSEKITEVSFYGVTNTSIIQLYKRILILGLANLEQLQQQDIERLYILAIDWADKLHLVAHQPQPYRVYFDQDRPPLFQAVNEQSMGQICCYLQLTELVAHLQQLLTQQQVSKAKINQGLAHHVLSSLLQLWMNRPGRRLARQVETGQVEVCIGIAAVHYMVNQQHDLVTGTHGQLNLAMDNLKIQAQVKSEVFIPGALNNLQEENDVWRLEYMGATSNEEMNFNFSADIYKSYFWQVVNSSAKGYCFAMMDKPPELLQVGKIIGIRVVANWYVGTIRWLAFNSAIGCLQAGIELLGPKARGVALKTKSQQQWFHGLFLAELQQPSSLITPALIYAVGDELEVRTLEAQYQIRLTKLLAQNHNFAQFEFSLG